MTDTQAIKDLVMSTVGATQLPGSARNFERIAQVEIGRYVRRSSHISSLSPTDLRIQHQPAKRAGDMVRFLASIDQLLQRLDATSNPVSTDEFKIGITAQRTAGVTLAEFRTGMSTLAGWLLANDGANIDAMFRGEI